MENKKKKIIAITASILVTVILVVVLVVLLTKNDYRTIQVEEVEGVVKLTRPEKGEMDLFAGENLISEDNVKTDAASKTILLIDSDKHVGADENTEFVIVSTGDENAGSINIKLISGSALFTIDNKLNEESMFDVETPNATFAVRGTSFKVDYDKDEEKSELDVTDGVVHVETASGESTDVEAGGHLVITEDGIIKENPKLTAALKEFLVKENFIYNGKPFYEYTTKELRELYKIKNYPEEKTPEQILESAGKNNVFFNGYQKNNTDFNYSYDYCVELLNDEITTHFNSFSVPDDKNEYGSYAAVNFEFDRDEKNVRLYEYLNYSDNFGETKARSFFIENNITSLEKCKEFFGIDDSMLNAKNQVTFYVPDYGTTLVEIIDDSFTVIFNKEPDIPGFNYFKFEQTPHFGPRIYVGANK